MEKYRFSEAERATLEGLSAALGVYQMVDKRVVPLLLSDGFCDLFGYDDRAEAYRCMERDMYRDVHPDDTARIADAGFQFANEGAKYEVIYRAHKPDKSGYHIIHAVGKRVVTDTGERLAYISYMDEGAYADEGDVQGIKLNRSLNNALHEESILKANHYDYLTGLPNMTFFFELAESGRRESQERGEGSALLFMNLVGMKFFNHKNGFAEGDRLLRAFSKVLARIFGSENCSRFSADHFAVFTAEEGLEDKIKRIFAEARTINGDKSLPVRIGVYLHSMDDVQISSACDRAKLACDAIHNNYESSFSYYDQSQRDDVIKRQYILANLDRAIEEKWIQVYFQPIVRAVNGRASDDEALSRWIDPVMGFLSPAEFIPVLEDAGVIYKLDLYVLEQVLEKLKIEEQAGVFLVPQSVNLSRSDFIACDIVEEIRRRVDAAGVSRDMITIEITESVIGSDFEFMKEQVERFRALGFPVWMDDFGSGYSSLDLLQSIHFDLIKFDMGFMRRLNEGEDGRIILTELVKMATSLGIDTVCEGVETEEQVHFLQEIGCSKLQGYYYAKPTPLAQILERYAQGEHIGYEDPRESAYYETVGRVNLFDLAVIASEEENALQKYFNTLPMGVVEVRDGEARYVRSNRSYRDFIRRYFGQDISVEKRLEANASSSAMSDAFRNMLVSCCNGGNRAFFDEKMPDGSIVHTFVRRIGTNPVTGQVAVAVAVLSITDGAEGTTYADIARALASDYYNIYYVNLETDDFIEYSSPIGGEGMAMERHGKDFFESSRRDAERVYEEDRAAFFAAFTKENIIRELDKQGVFSTSYRLMDTGRPMYVGMKVVRANSDGKHIVIGTSIIDRRVKQQKAEENARRERVVYSRIAALSGNYIALYTVDPKTGAYLEYSVSADYESLGFEKEGADFFHKGIEDGKKAVYPDDLDAYLREFSKENVLRCARENGLFTMRYRLVIGGAPVDVMLRAALVREDGREKLIVGVNKLQENAKG